jgi:two-component system nitrogen regulation response regulator GlnG
MKKGEYTTRTVASDSVEVLEFRPFSLEVIEGPDAGRTMRFESRSASIGGSRKSDFVLADETVSRHHCLLEATESGYRLQDQGSRNGTRLGGCRVGWALLVPGTVFQVGSTKVRFTVSDDESAVETAELSRVVQLGRMFGASNAMRELFATLSRIALTEASVLLEAESGCGKELAAEAIHGASLRADGPFEVFDCASVPENLVGSELFGHVKGAFTGATDANKGAFARANGGTLFLDELGELPVSLQPQFLRVLDSGSFKPLGAQKPETVDVRVVAATNRDLSKMVEEGKFRLDLFHRLAVIRVRIPPLRERLEDVPVLFRHFLDEFAARGRPIPEVKPEMIEKLKSYGWPGNVRELRNLVSRGVALQADFLDLPISGAGLSPKPDDEPNISTNELPPDGPMPPYHATKERLVDGWERAYCVRILENNDYNVSAAAREAGMHRKSLEYLLDKHGLKKPR